MFAATAGLDSKVGGSSSDHVTQANLLVAGKSWQARTVRLGFALGLFLRHGLYLLVAWYAAQASSRGGTTVVRRGIEARVAANFISVAVAVGNSDHNNAIAP